MCYRMFDWSGVTWGRTGCELVDGEWWFVITTQPSSDHPDLPQQTFRIPVGLLRQLVGEIPATLATDLPESEVARLEVGQWCSHRH